jgi:protein involved in polysaccharide export with SLBB domain
MMRRRGGVVRAVGRTAVVAGTATAVAGGVSRRQSNKQAATQEDAAASQQAAYDQGVADGQPPPPAPAPSGDDTMAQLQKLGDMHTQGVLNDDEFATAKAKLLGS